LAYILGNQDFYDLTLKVSPQVLIPRDDTAILVETCLAHITSEQAEIADLGTGSGAVAITLAHKRPTWNITGVDTCKDALNIARENAATHQCDITFLQSNWCQNLQGQFDAIVSNPPYLAEDDPHLSEDGLAFEPLLALVAANKGFAAFESIAAQAKSHLLPEGILMFEHGADQAEHVAAILAKHDFYTIQHATDTQGHIRVTWGMAH